MAIVEDGMRHESEEENEIEVVLDEDHDDDGEQDSDSSDDDDDEDEEVLEHKVVELESRIKDDPYNYDDHIELIQALWALSELDRWRSAFERLQQLSLMRAEHWLLRLQTEMTLAHSSQSRDHIAELFQQASLDCYSIPILSEWCTWALTGGDADAARAQLGEVVRRAGADPFSGKLFWDAKLEFEKAQLDSMSEEDPNYKEQRQRVLWCLEEAFTRPLLRSEEAWQPLQELALLLHDQQYLDKIKMQHEIAIEYLQKITPYEDRLLTTEDNEEKCKIFQEYIDIVKELANEDKYAECDSDGILKVLYDRASTECLATPACHPLLVSFARHAQAASSRATVRRVLAACARRCPRRATFWTLQMQQAEHEEKGFDEVKTIFETALSKGMESYKDAESLWLSYLEFTRRRTDFTKEADVERLRRTFRLAWDSLAEAWGEEANDCEVPLYWARLEYRRMQDPKQGKEIFEEIFKYGDNKTLSKYWEALIQLEVSTGARGEKGERWERRVRELCKRALRSVVDYPPAAARIWTDYERDFGQLPAARTCADLCEVKVKEWRDSYQAMKDKLIGKQKGKQSQNKKAKLDNNKKKVKDPKFNNGKRKAEETPEDSEVKRKKDSDMEVDEKEKEVDSGGGQKRQHDGDDGKSADAKRLRTDSGSSDTCSAGREACTLFISNLDFNLKGAAVGNLALKSSNALVTDFGQIERVDEQSLRSKLSEFGEIVSMRVKAGVKAFGGSICYCQYKSSDAVEAAIKHDRTPLDGRPMFLSRYSAAKSKPSFKYALTTEKNKLFVKNLPFSHCSKDQLAEIFDKHGKLKDIRIVTHKDGKPKGLAYIEYEDEQSAALALQKTDGLELGGRRLQAAVSAPPPRAPSAAPAPALGQLKRDTGGGMRRTQLSSFIPSVLQKPSTSKANGSHTNGDTRPLSNNDFRSMLLKK